MTETQEKALALWNDERAWEGLPPWFLGDVEADAGFRAICRAIEELEAEKAARAAEREQHEAFRQEVSDAVEDALAWADRVYTNSTVRDMLARFIIAKPDPLVEHLVKVEGYYPRVAEEVAGRLRTARGLKIVEDK